MNFKSRPKSENFRNFWRFPPIFKHLTKLFLFFRYTVYPRGHVGALFKKIQVEKFFTKIIESPLSMALEVRPMRSTLIIVGSEILFAVEIKF